MIQLLVGLTKVEQVIQSYRLTELYVYSRNLRVRHIMSANDNASSPIPSRTRTVSMFLCLVLSVITYFAFSAKARAASYQTALQTRELTVPPPPHTTPTRQPTPLTRHFSVSVHTIHSFGQPRSGSTFQFVLLCVIAHLRSDSESCVQGNQHIFK